MNPSNPSDQLFIAERFIFIDDHTLQLSKLAIQKIKSLKLAFLHAAYCKNQQELFDMVKKSLLNYVTPGFVLCEEGFFESEMEN
jgi:hypothetical protein